MEGKLGPQIITSGVEKRTTKSFWLCALPFRFSHYPKGFKVAPLSCTIHFECGLISADQNNRESWDGQVDNEFDVRLEI